MSAYVLDALSGALLNLMERKPLNKVTVDELCAEASIGRATYFRNFRSKEEILEAYLMREWRAYEGQHRLLEHPFNSDYRLRHYFSFCFRIRRLNDLLIAQGKSEIILRIYNHIFENRDNDALPTQESYALSYAAYGLYGVFLRWAAGGYQESVGEMAELVRREILADYKSDALS